LLIAGVGTTNCAKDFEQSTKRGDSGAKLLSSVGGLAVGEDGGHLDESLLELVNGSEPVICLELVDANFHLLNLVGKIRRWFKAVGLFVCWVTREAEGHVLNDVFVVVHFTLQGGVAGVGCGDGSNNKLHTFIIITLFYSD